MADTADTSSVIVEEDLKETEELIEKAWKIHVADKELLGKLNDYVRGRHPGPYTPRNASQEYRLLAQRSISNWIPLVIAAPAQSLYVEGYRLGSDEERAKRRQAVWQRNRLDARQASVHRGALQDGLCFAYVEKPGGLDPESPASVDYTKVNLYSASRGTALWFDPANDERPAAVMFVDREPQAASVGRGRFVDNTTLYTFDLKDDGSVENVKSVEHGFSRIPVVTFNPFKDLDGRAYGIVEPLIPVQDRINQTIFDLLIAQTYGSFKVRTAAGLTPPMKMESVPVKLKDIRNELTPDDPRYSLGPEHDDDIVGARQRPVVDESTGRPVYEPITADATRFLVAKDPQTKFGQLDETPLNGFIESISMSVHHMAAIAQVPPHHLLGDMANLSADALTVAESSLARMVAELQHSFGESWEQVMDLIGESEGDGGLAETTDENTETAEVMWRDMSPRSMTVIVDALSKMVESLGIPPRGTWRRIPGATEAEIISWEREAEEAVVDNRDDPRSQLARSFRQAPRARVTEEAVNDAAGPV